MKGKNTRWWIVSHTKCGAIFCCYMLNKTWVWWVYVNSLFFIFFYVNSLFFIMSIPNSFFFCERAFVNLPSIPLASPVPLSQRYSRKTMNFLTGIFFAVFKAPCMNQWQYRVGSVYSLLFSKASSHPNHVGFFPRKCVACWKNAGGDFVVPGGISGNEGSSWLLLLLVAWKCISRIVAVPEEHIRKCLPRSLFILETNGGHSSSTSLVCCKHSSAKLFRGLDMRCLVCIHLLTAL